ncbi:MAG: hypothetical protein ACPLW6_05010 [Desulfurella sp.]|uniref:hypothetical protein n=1 Tax=Desulfurella TaxID=33001 RepID=UPI000CB61E8E|nr:MULTISPECIES: hypothetical protein [Desulfurella]PMP67625.1 MAG: hypothetical protein C0192_03210 [Desulfurella multipotens]PMP89201.1 MAG: hypothetical protein C0173_06050 [Desulfurella sp.]HEX13307.1 hypothetical protein [Desulfurella acetivorans]
MKFLLLLFSFVFFLSSCASIPKPQESTAQIPTAATGIFKAKTKVRNIDGFFRISPTNSTIDIASPLGFALYGIYINGNDLYVKDYMSGAKFTNADLEKLNIPKKDSILLYENNLIYFTQNFFNICDHNDNSNIHIIACENVSNYRLPKVVEFVHKDDLLKLTMEKMRIENLQKEKQ